MFSIIYLYVFNRITRQSLHDLAVGTLVVNVGGEKQEGRKAWYGHKVVVVVLYLAAAVVPAFTTKLVQDDLNENMPAVLSALSNEPGVTYATLSSGSLTVDPFNEAKESTTFISTQVYLDSNNIADVELARRLASVVMAHYPEALQKDAVQITLAYGYDIDISSRWYRHSHRFEPRGAE